MLTYYRLAHTGARFDPPRVQGEWSITDENGREFCLALIQGIGPQVSAFEDGTPALWEFLSSTAFFLMENHAEPLTRASVEECLREAGIPDAKAGAR